MRKVSIKSRINQNKFTELSNAQASKLMGGSSDHLDINGIPPDNTERD